ncbi:transmembrane protein 127-like [Leptodactylus fuscus]|uniref:transmembrane protein 127-like n=1 Tax=Leptodactylus fuscus TaxID=238119 RepID=UPI003F4E6F28
MALRGGRMEGRAAGTSAVAPVPERCLGAAFMQCLGVVCASTALSDPGWLLVQVEQQNYVYGAAYVLHLGSNLTEPGPHQFLHQSGLYVLVLLTACCYVSILVGFSAFLLDFLGTRYMGIKMLWGILLPPILHFITVLSSAGAVALCTYLYIVLYQEVHFQLISLPANTMSLGESYYFAVSAFVASIPATALSISYAAQYLKGSGTSASTSQTEVTTPLLQEPDAPEPLGEYG